MTPALEGGRVEVEIRWISISHRELYEADVNPKHRAV